MAEVRVCEGKSSFFKWADGVFWTERMYDESWERTQMIKTSNNVF